MGVVRYSAGILEWTKAELSEIDVRTRKVLTMNGGFHRQDSALRLYMKRKEGGRGLISVEECVRLEEKSLFEYVKANKESMLKEVVQMRWVLKEQKESSDDYRERKKREKRRIG